MEDITSSTMNREARQHAPTHHHQQEGMEEPVLRVVMIEGPARAVDDLIDRFFSRPQTGAAPMLPSRSTNGHSSHQQVAELPSASAGGEGAGDGVPLQLPEPRVSVLAASSLQASAQSEGSSVPPAERAEIRVRPDEENLELTPEVAIFVHRLRQEWGDDDVRVMLADVKEESAIILLHLARQMPRAVPYEEVRTRMGIDGHTLGAYLSSYGRWCSAHGKTSFLYRSNSTYYVPAFIAQVLRTAGAHLPDRVPASARAAGTAPAASSE